jgi:PiT family inorganic phosphate transporter/sulfate permease
MELAVSIAVVLSTFLALSIGANNSAASMGAAYGAGARTKREAVVLIAAFALVGALVAGTPVIKTMGKGIIPDTVLTTELGLVIIVLLIAVAFITWANVLSVPVATTHAIVCAMAGLGIYTKSLNTEKFMEIVLWWVVTPFVSFTVNFLIGRFFYARTLNFLIKRYSEGDIVKILGLFLTISGVYVAFSAGANNSANAVGPIVGMGIVDPFVGAVLAGLGMGVGAILFGGRVIETVGKQITEICILRAVSVELVGGTIILFASLMGIPVSLAEIITSGIIGFSCANQGFQQTFENRHVLRIAFFWFLVPFFAVGASYGLCVVYYSYHIREIFARLF